MNTIRRKIQVQDGPHQQELTFEGENGKFDIFLNNFSPMGGSQTTRISLSLGDATVLKHSLELFLK